MFALRGRAAVALLPLLAAIALTACGGSSSTDEKKPAAVASAAQTPGLEPPSTYATNARKGTAGSATLNYLRYVQIGAIPPALLFYDGKVRKLVGINHLAGAMLAERAVLSPMKLSVRASEALPTGTLVIVEGKTSGAPATTWSFILRRRGSRWRIAYDTLMEEQLRPWVIASTQDSIDPKSKTASAEAV